jgi:hypothetical protein
MAAIAISAIEINARHTASGKSRSAAKLKVFFDACSTAVAAYVDSVLPTVVSRVRTAANTLTITCSEALSPSGSVPLTAFVVKDSGGTVTRPATAVVVSGSTIVVTATGVIATDTVAYTAPTDGTQVFDASGSNALASFTAAAIA